MSLATRLGDERERRRRMNIDLELWLRDVVGQTKETVWGNAKKYPAL